MSRPVLRLEKRRQRLESKLARIRVAKCDLEMDRLLIEMQLRDVVDEIERRMAGG